MSELRALGREEILAALHAMTAPAVLAHRSPDGDAVGSAVATVRYLRRRGIDARLWLPDGLPERLAFLVGELPLFEGIPREIVTVDVASLSQTGTAAPLVTAAERVVSIDHHAISTPFAPHYTRPDAAAAGEILFDLFSDGGRLPLPAELAAPLYAAIVSDTGGFRFQNAGPATHRAAAALLESGIDAADISRRLLDLRSDGELSAMAYAATSAARYFDGRVSVLSVPRTLPASLGCTEGDFDAVIDTVRTRRGVEIAAVIRERADGTVRLSLRAVSADVSSVAAAFGGGGHRLAAGATLPAATAEEGVALLLPALAQILGEE